MHYDKCVLVKLFKKTKSIACKRQHPLDNNSIEIGLCPVRSVLNVIVNVLAVRV